LPTGTPSLGWHGTAGQRIVPAMDLGNRIRRGNSVAVGTIRSPIPPGKGRSIVLILGGVLEIEQVGTMPGQKQVVGKLLAAYAGMVPAQELGNAMNPSPVKPAAIIADLLHLAVSIPQGVEPSGV